MYLVKCHFLNQSTMPFKLFKKLDINKKEKTFIFSNFSVILYYFFDSLLLIPSYSAVINCYKSCKYKRQRKQYAKQNWTIDRTLIRDH